MSFTQSKDELLLERIGIPGWEPSADGAVLVSPPSSGLEHHDPVLEPLLFSDFVVFAKDVLFMFFTIALQELKDFFRSVCSQEQLGPAQQTSVLHMLSKHRGPELQPLVLERG